MTAVAEPAAGALRRLAVPERYDLVRTLGPLAFGPNDPCARVSAAEAWWAARTPAGPGTLHLRRAGDGLAAAGYGPGAGWLLERADAVAGLRDDVTGFPPVAARHPLVRRLAREHAGVRLPATGRAFQHLVPTILGQKVTAEEAVSAYRKIVRHFGEPAPGPRPDLLLPPDPAAVAAAPYWLFHPFGVEQRRADTLRRAAAAAAAIEAAPDPATARRRLLALPGIGPWSTAEVVRIVFGEPDTVTVGDYHLPNTVAYALAGEARATDERMLELLAPFAGQRARVVRLIEAAGIAAPRYGPRASVRSFARF
jgi:3-methyladenine DNA glycosylase/8-oxoguanine DNA glycosylase